MNKFTIKIYTKKDCPDCGNAKKLIKELNKEIFENYEVEIQEHDIETLDGLTDSAYHGILSTPSVVITENNEKSIIMYIKMVPEIEELKKVMKECDETKKTM